MAVWALVMAATMFCSFLLPFLSRRGFSSSILKLGPKSCSIDMLCFIFIKVQDQIGSVLSGVSGLGFWIDTNLDPVVWQLLCLSEQGIPRFWLPGHSV